MSSLSDSGVSTPLFDMIMLSEVEKLAKLSVSACLFQRISFWKNEDIFSFASMTFNSGWRDELKVFRWEKMSEKYANESIKEKSSKCSQRLFFRSRWNIATSFRSSTTRIITWPRESHHNSVWNKITSWSDPSSWHRILNSRWLRALGRIKLTACTAVFITSFSWEGRVLQAR